MITKTTYVCERCGKEFHNEVSCKSHEERHVKVKEIIKVRHALDEVQPNKITVILSNNQEMTFYREDHRS